MTASTGAPETREDGGRLDEPGRPGVLLAVVLLLSTGLVWGAFNPAPHTGGDNAAYVSLAYSLLDSGTYSELYDPAAPPHTKYPPVFPGLLAMLMVLGVRTWTGLKIVAGVSTVAAVCLTFLWARPRIGAAWAFGIAVAFAVSSGVIYYSHWILSDPTFVALTLLSLWALRQADDEGEGVRWLVVGIVAAAAAYFTRSAGLPLVVALVAWLALHRRWKVLVATVVGIGAPALAWAARARGDQYVSEFWFVDPYQPHLGRVDVLGLGQRIVGNAVAYTADHLPSGVLGARGWVVALFGLVLVVLGLVGWVLSMRRRVGAAELFFPLYAGLLLLWPEVWSGDRFALPLFPLLFVYAATVLKASERPLGRLGPTALGTLALLVVLIPAGGSWYLNVRDARACSSVVRELGPFACYPPGVTGYAAAAQWATNGLPPGSVVLTRKPRIFYVLSGVPSRTFPFDTESEPLLDMADNIGARYVLLDQWDNVSSHYLGSAVGGRPKAFCAVQGWDQGGGGAQILGVLPRDDRSAAVDPSVAAAVGWCPASYTAETARGSYLPSSTRIPLLDGLGP